MALRVQIQPGFMAVARPGSAVGSGRYGDYTLHTGMKTDSVMQHSYAGIDGNRSIWQAFVEVFQQAPDVWWQMYYPDGRLVVPPARWFPQAQQFVQSTAANLLINPDAWTGQFPIASNIAGAPAEPVGVIYTVHRRPQI
ncbi:hypothetical protein [Methylobacterium oxalidis]|uniref:hypothetical protein n=1 Tax=Methylobacterium oxalidis TaxID=944322 RepID=UPI0033145B3A